MIHDDQCAKVLMAPMHMREVSCTHRYSSAAYPIAIAIAARATRYPLRLPRAARRQQRCLCGDHMHNSSISICLEALHRRNRRLTQEQQEEGTTLEQEQVQQVWKAWQDNWQQNLERSTGVRVKNPRSKFESYCYERAGPETPGAHIRGKRLLWCIIRTGRSPNMDNPTSYY